MHLVLGLGNPGSKYARTRHNAGFGVLDLLRANLDLPEFRLETKFRAQICLGRLGADQIILAKPQTFMNLSGESARALLDFYRLTPAQVIAVYDDKDLPFGTVRVRADGGHGGHNGVRNLITHLGTNEFSRVRIGVANSWTEQTPTDAFVLADFSAEESQQLPEIYEAATREVIKLIEQSE